MARAKKNWGGGISGGVEGSGEGSGKPERTEFSGPFTARGRETGEKATLPGVEGKGKVTARERLLVSLVESGLSYREVAEITGVGSVAGLRVSVARARKKLKASGRLFQIACDRRDEELVPLAMDRMMGMVDAGVPEAVFRTLEGSGVLQGRGGQGTGNAAKGGAPTLQISFTTVGNSPTIAMGGIVGAPRLVAAPVALPDVVSVPVQVKEGV